MVDAPSIDAGVMAARRQPGSRRGANRPEAPGAPPVAVVPLPPLPPFDGDIGGRRRELRRVGELRLLGVSDGVVLHVAPETPAQRRTARRR
jgi:hypothetical protein